MLAGGQHVMARTYSLGLRAGWSRERQRSPPKRRPIAQRTERGRIGSCHKQPQTRAELATFASLGARRVSRDVTDGGERKRMERETQTKEARTVTRRAPVAVAAASGLALAAALVSARPCPAAPLPRDGPARLARHGPRNCHRHKVRNLA